MKIVKCMIVCMIVRIYCKWEGIDENWVTLDNSMVLDGNWATLGKMGTRRHWGRWDYMGTGNIEKTGLDANWATLRR